VFDVSLVKAKASFFDRAQINKLLDPRERKYLARAGALTRSIMKRSIRKSGKKRTRSLPGQPPRSHTGLLKKHIYFWMDPGTRSVIVAPASLKRAGEAAPDVLEFGGRVTYGWMKGKNIQARPFVRPALEEAEKSFQRIWNTTA